MTDKRGYPVTPDLRFGWRGSRCIHQAEIDVELGDIFAKIAIDKTLGSTLLKDSGLNFAKVEHYARTILHPGYREEQS